MLVTERINSEMQKLPLAYQREVLRFIEFLSARSQREEDETERHLWSEFSLEQAMKDLDDEVEYSEADLIERWRPSDPET